MKKTLNLGCGDRTYTHYPEGYECWNVDNRDSLKKVDQVCDVRDLPFTDESFDYILASDIVEHFPIKETPALLKEWIRVLKVGGIIEMRTPNLDYWTKEYKEKRNAKVVSYHLFGGQQYSGNFHYVVFDRAWLRELCQARGLKEIDYREEDGNFVMKLRRVE
jgi:predicted SAM-dependent methyltransferase